MNRLFADIGGKGRTILGTSWQVYISSPINLLIGVLMIPAFLEQFGSEIFSIHLLALGFLQFGNLAGFGLDRAHMGLIAQGEQKTENASWMSVCYILANLIVSQILSLFYFLSSGGAIYVFLGFLFAQNSIVALIKNRLVLEASYTQLLVLTFSSAQLPVAVPIVLGYSLGVSDFEGFMFLSNVVRFLLCAYLLWLLARNHDIALSDFRHIPKFVGYDFSMFCRTFSQVFAETWDKILFLLAPSLLPLVITVSYIEKIFLPLRQFSMTIVYFVGEKILSKEVSIFILWAGFFISSIVAFLAFDIFNNLIYFGSIAEPGILFILFSSSIFFQILVFTLYQLNDISEIKIKLPIIWFDAFLKLFLLGVGSIIHLNYSFLDFFSDLFFKFSLVAFLISSIILSSSVFISKNGCKTNG